MAWLVTHMWMALSIVGLLALLLGWSFRGAILLGRTRRAEIERELLRTELDQANSEVDGLYAAQKKISETAPVGDERLQEMLQKRDTKIAKLTEKLGKSQEKVATLKANLEKRRKAGNGAVAAASAAAGAFAGAATATAVAQDQREGAPQVAADVWRQRHLESRVRFLEAEQSEHAAAGEANPEQVAELEKRLTAAQTKAAEAEARLIEIEGQQGSGSGSELEAELSRTQASLNEAERRLAEANPDQSRATILALEDRLASMQASASETSSKLTMAEARASAAEAEMEALKVNQGSGGSITAGVLTGLATAGVAGVAATAMADDGASLGGEEAQVSAEKAKWEADYLRKRVEALENQLQQATAKITPIGVDAAQASPPVSDDDLGAEALEELANLRWRNRYLEGRLAYFEGAVEDGQLQENSESKIASVAVDETPAIDAAPNSQTLAAPIFADDTTSSDVEKTFETVENVPDALESSLSSETVSPVETTLMDDVVEANTSIFSTTAPEQAFALGGAVTQTASDVSVEERAVVEDVSGSSDISVSDIDAALAGQAPEAITTVQPQDAKVQNPFSDKTGVETIAPDVGDDVAKAISAVPDSVETHASDRLSNHVASDVRLVRPPSLDAAVGGKGDDLTVIGGIGPKIMSLLNSLGVYHFEQIAAWTPENAAWVDDHLSFSGRIERERWVEQASILSSDG